MKVICKLKALSGQLRRRPFVANVAKLASGSALAQVIAFACAPILTRLYAPEDFGLLGIFAAVMAVCVTLATLRYDLAVMLPKSNAAAWSLLKFASKLTLAIVLVGFVVTLPLRTWFANLLNAPYFSTYFILLPLLVLGAGWGSLASNWAVRVKHFGVLAKTTVSSVLGGNAFKIGAGSLGFGEGALIVAMVFQQWFYLGMLVGLLRKTTPEEVVEQGEGRTQAKAYIEFPRYRMPQDALSALANQLPNILLALYFSPVIVGLYLLTVRVLQAPSGVIREAVGKVFYQKIVETKNNGGDLLRLVDRMTLIMLGLTILPILAFVLFGRSIFVLIFGPEWAEAGRYSQYIIFMIALAFANVPGVSAATALGKNKQLLGFGICSMVARVSAIVIGGMYFSPYVAIAIYALTCSVKDIALIAWCRLTVVKFNRRL